MEKIAMESDNFEAVLAQAKQEILSDQKEGQIPSFKILNSFQDLHCYVDANWYGGFCEENYAHSENFEFENAVQNALDKWIKEEHSKTK